jgi:hypothetical protein
MVCPFQRLPASNEGCNGCRSDQVVTAGMCRLVLRRIGVWHRDHVGKSVVLGIIHHRSGTARQGGSDGLGARVSSGGFDQKTSLDPVCVSIDCVVGAQRVEVVTDRIVG